MANKSKKRIKHEQYVYIKKLERELKYLRENAVMYDPVVLKSRHLIAPTFDRAYEEKMREYVFEKACREMADELMKSRAVEILNYYRNLYYAEPQVTERGIVANAINDYFKDVVPRAEVANKICCEIEEEIVAALESNYRALKEWDDGRCNDYILEMVNRIKGKIDALRGVEAFVGELKKKYTEGEK